MPKAILAGAGYYSNVSEAIIGYGDLKKIVIGQYITSPVKSQCQKMWNIEFHFGGWRWKSIKKNLFTYSGRTQKPNVQVVFAGEIIDPENYIVTYSDKNSVNVGTYTVTVKMILI